MNSCFTNTTSPVNMAGEAAFIECLIEALGPAAVIATERGLKRYNCSTGELRRTIPVAVLPASTVDVQKTVQICEQFRVPYYPISTGRNWGYGSALPPADQTIVIDLSRMNRVLSVQAELGYCIVEPGVTQSHLFNYLQQHQLPLAIDPTGAGPNGSIIGNALDRGHGIGHYGDHFGAIAGLEVVLPDGTVTKTGLWRMGDHPVVGSFKWGCGPYLDGLFSQGSFGIVTKAIVWLEPLSEASEACYFSLRGSQPATPVIDALTSLRTNGCITTYSFANRSRVLTTAAQYPFAEAGGITPLPVELEHAIAERRHIPAWSGMLVVRGTKELVRAKKSSLRRLLGPHVQSLRFFSKKKLERVSKVRSIVKGLTGIDIAPRYAALSQSFRVLHGEPLELTLRSAYWRNRSMKTPDRNLDPARDGCGLLWFAPLIPALGSEVTRFCEMVEPLIRSFGFEACFAFLPVSDRSVICSLPILFDATSDEEVEQAHSCYAKIFERCHHAGFYSYRVGAHAMKKLTGEEGAYWQLVATLKSAVDPHHLLAPGRYCPVPSLNNSQDT